MIANAYVVWDTVSTLYLSPPERQLDFINVELPAQLECAY